MGLLISSEDVASVYSASWYEDWNRLDNTTDTDQDRLLDAWEVEHGLNRTQRSVIGDANIDESRVDNDQDGLTNYAEQLHGGDPNNADTDGDCINDGLEVAWAQATALKRVDRRLHDQRPHALGRRRRRARRPRSAGLRPRRCGH